MTGAYAGSSGSTNEKIRALEEVLQSETFSRSGRLQRLLRFVCEAEIEGRESDLNEYTIGTMALGRPADFCPLEDSSVRSRAHELRQRLEKYYASESPEAPIRIELRKGSYVPRFCRTHRDEAFSHEPAAESETPERASSPDPASPQEEGERVGDRIVRKPPSGRYIVVAAFAAGACAMFAALSLWSAAINPGVRVLATHLETTTGPAWTPELEALWQPFFGRSTPLLIAFETRFFLRMGPLMVRDWHVNGPDQIQDSHELMRARQLFDPWRVGDRDYADAGTPQAVFCLTRLLSARVPNMALKNSLDVTAADLRDNSVVLLGKPGMDPQIEQVLAQGELVDKGETVVNVHPRPGEQREYTDRADPTNPDRWSQKYSVITMMPGSSAQKRILALTASGSEQPASLAWYMTNPDSARDLVRHLRVADGTIPEYFQVLVRAEYKSKGVVSVRYVTHRALIIR